MSDLIFILIALLPCVAFLSLVVYYVVLKTMSVPKVTFLRWPMQLVGVSIKSTDANIERDDALLWAEFKKIREENGLPKPESTFVVRLHRLKGEELYEYFIGIPGIKDDMPAGFKYLEIPPQTYVWSRHRFKKGTSWLKSATKVKFYIYNKWLPDSKYELNRDQPVKAVEIHNVKKGSRNRFTQIFVAVKEVDISRYH